MTTPFTFTQTPLPAPELALASDVTFDAGNGDVLAAYFSIRDGEVASTRELVEGAAFGDFGPDEQLLGVEVIAPCRLSDLLGAARGEPPVIRSFLCNAIPHGLVKASEAREEAGNGPIGVTNGAEVTST